MRGKKMPDVMLLMLSFVVLLISSICRKMGFGELESYHHRLLSLKSLGHRRKLQLMKELKQIVMKNDTRLSNITFKQSERVGLRLECPSIRHKSCDRHFYPALCNLFNRL